ncbi:MAG: type II secretion system F family protein [Planctomycetota bacterium]
MPSFAYQAIDPNGTTIRGTLLAESPEVARDTVRSRGLRVQSISERGASGASVAARLADVFGSIRGGGRRAADTVLADVSTMLNAGATLPDALSVTAEQYRSGPAGRVATHLAESVNRGSSLSEAMNQRPTWFGPLAVALVRASERSGGLGGALAEHRRIGERWRAVRSRLLGALLYPVFVMVTGVAVCVFLSAYVLPAVTDVLRDSSRTLPLVTRIVLTGSEVLASWWPLVLVGITCLAVGFRALVRWAPARDRIEAVALHTPVLSRVIRAQEVAHASTIIAGLLRGGVVLVEALELASETARLRRAGIALRSAAESVRCGGDAADAMRNAVYPPVLVHVIAVGQRSGTLEPMLEELAADYDDRLTRAIARATSLLEPVLILLIASFVGAIAMAVLLPILEAGNAL